MREAASKGRTDGADPNTQTSVWKQERPQHHVGVPKIHFFLRKNTQTLCTKKEHKKEERFPLLVDFISYRQPGWIFWRHQRSLQLRGDPSPSRLNFSLTNLSHPWKNSASSQALANAFLLQGFLLTALLYLQHSVLQPQTSPFPPSLLKKIPERDEYHIQQHIPAISARLSTTINGDHFVTVKWITRMQKTAMAYRLRVCYAAWISSPTLSREGFASETTQRHLLSSKTVPLSPQTKLSSGSCQIMRKSGWERNVRESKYHSRHEAVCCSYLGSIHSSISRKPAARSSSPFGYRKPGFSRRGWLSGSSAPACGDQRVQGKDLEHSSVLNWASGAQGQCAPFAVSCWADTDLVLDQLESPAPFMLVAVSIFKGCQSTTFHDD